MFAATIQNLAHDLGARPIQSAEIADTPVLQVRDRNDLAAMLYAENIGPRLAIGWTMGTVVSALGVWLSLHLDLPTGATIVCTFGLVLTIMAALRPLIRRAG